MKCDYCGAVMPDPPRPPSFSESYKELREEIGKLEYDNGVLIKDKKKMEEDKKATEDWLLSCQNSLNHQQTLEKIHKRGKKIWKGIAIVLMATNVVWLCMVITIASQ